MEDLFKLKACSANFASLKGILVFWYFQLVFELAMGGNSWTSHIGFILAEMSLDWINVRLDFTPQQLIKKLNFLTFCTHNNKPR